MMFTKSTVLITLFAATQVAVATPPACLLAAVNTYQDPADVAGACKSNEVMSTLKSACGSDYNTAMTAFKAVCKGAGVGVSEPKPSSSKKPTGSATTSKKPTHPTPRPSSGGSMTTKATGSATQGGNQASSTQGGSGTGGASATGKTQQVTKTSTSSKASTTAKGGSSSPSMPQAPATVAHPASNGTMTTSASVNPTSATGNPGNTPVPSNAAGHLEVGAYLAMVAAGVVAAM